MFIPDLHIENKNIQYKFYLNSDLFEDTILFENKTEYEKDRERKNKYLFIIDNKDFKTKIIYNDDNININILKFFDEEKKEYIEYNNNNVVKIFTDDNKAICYISDKYMNWYLIKINKDDKNGTITCITEKIQDENEIQGNEEEEQINYGELNEKNENTYINEDIQYDIESIE